MYIPLANRELSIKFILSTSLNDHRQSILVIRIIMLLLFNDWRCLAFFWLLGNLLSGNFFAMLINLSWRSTFCLFWRISCLLPFLHLRLRRWSPSWLFRRISCLLPFLHLRLRRWSPSWLFRSIRYLLPVLSLRLLGWSSSRLFLLFRWLIC